jgi:hypothetical protein
MERVTLCVVVAAARADNVGDDVLSAKFTPASIAAEGEASLEIGAIAGSTILQVLHTVVISLVWRGCDPCATLLLCACVGGVWNALLALLGRELVAAQSAAGWLVDQALLLPALQLESLSPAIRMLRHASPPGTEGATGFVAPVTTSKFPYEKPLRVAAGFAAHLMLFVLST